MTKPRDSAGNDFIVACMWLAEAFFVAVHKRNSDPNDAEDSRKMRIICADLHSTLMRHYAKWI